MSALLRKYWLDDGGRGWGRKEEVETVMKAFNMGGYLSTLLVPVRVGGKEKKQLRFFLDGLLLSCHHEGSCRQSAHA